MTKHNETPVGFTSGLPVLFMVDADREARIATESALRRRFASDYRVLTSDSPEAALDVLKGLAQRGEAVALVVADLHLPGMGGVEFLGQAHTLHPRAMRALLVSMDRRGPGSKRYSLVLSSSSVSERPGWPWLATSARSLSATGAK